MSNNKIWDKILSSGEEIKFEFSLGDRYVNVAKYALIILGIPLLFLYGLGIIFIIGGFVWGWYLKRANNFAFTNKRVLVLKGWLSTNLTSVDYDKITDVKVEQSFFDRIVFKTGRLIIDTAGTGFQEIVLINIENPYEIKKKLDSTRENLMK